MFDSLTGRTPHEDAQPDASRHRGPRKRLGAILAMASALAMGLTMMIAPQAAQAQTSIQGQWTVVHGGTGIITINIDETYTSTCKVNPNYKDAWCPAPSGTLLYGSAYVDFNGDDGSSTSYRVSGLVSRPDTITSYFGSRTSSPLVMKRGISFVCTDWTAGKSTPLVEYDAATNLVYATGSHELLGSGDFRYDLAETAPNYFQSGQCSDFPTPAAPPSMLIDSATDASIPAEPGYWLPQALVTIKDAAGAPVAGATVNGVFDNGYGKSCVTIADGTCTVSARSSVPDSTGYYSMSFRAIWAIRDGMLWDGHGVYVDLHKPTAPTPTPTPTQAPTPTPQPTLTQAPTPATHHIGDLDSATTAPSSLLTWQPKVTATVMNSTGKAVAGATVSGTFSHHKGTVTCTTAANGTCTLGNFSLSRYTRTTVFTVTNATLASSTYAPKANTDPDGDSDGTTITVKRQ